MAKEEENLVHLSIIISELTSEGKAYYSEMSLRQKFDKLLTFVNSDLKQLYKDKNGHYTFFDEDKELIKALIIEMNQPYLDRLVSKKKPKSLKDGLAESIEFRKRMLNYMEGLNLQDSVIKTKWENIIEILSRHQLQESQMELMEKIKIAGRIIVEENMNYETLCNTITEISNNLDRWVYKSFGKKLDQEK